MLIYIFLTNSLFLFFYAVDGAGFSSHNSAAKRSSQFEYFGPRTANFNPDSYYGLASYRFDLLRTRIQPSIKLECYINICFIY